VIDISDISKALRSVQYATDRKSRWARYAGWGLTGAAAYTQARGLYDRYRNWSDHTIEVRADEPVYVDVMEWVLNALPADRRRSTRATVGPWGDEDSMDAVPESTQRGRRRMVRLVHDGHREAVVNVGGHRVRVLVRQMTEVENWGRGGDEGAGAFSRRRVEPSVVFTSRDAAGQAAVVDLLQKLTDIRFASGMERPEVDVWTLSRWGGWSRGVTVGRSLASVVQADGLAERVGADIATFLSMEDAYVQAGLPWHRGYLFHGAPGTGKSSLPRALAYELGLRIYTVSLPSVRDGDALTSALADINERSLLLLEDIDVASASRVRDDDGSGVSLSDLLNALDGIATPHGLITVMTTNRLDVLDDALVRSGRADFVAEFGLPDQDQFIDLVAAVTGLDLALVSVELPQLPDCGVSHADIVGWMKNHLDDPWAAIAAVKDRVENIPAF
jgi:hypothetical protein